MSTSSGEKYHGVQTENTVIDGSNNSLSRPTFAQKTKRHCARFWWVHLIVFCICFLIIALCLVYVGFPRIAQDGVDASSITIESLKFLNSKANSFIFSQDGILHNPKIFTPTLEPFNVSVYLVTGGVAAAVPMIQIPMPSIHAVDNSQVNIDNVNVTILSMDAVNNYTLAVLTQKNVTTRLVGSTKLHIGALPVNTIQYNHDITYGGLNGLEGFNVTDVRLNLSAATGEPNLKGTAVIPNVSPLTIDMGNVTLNMATTQAGIVGNVTINDLTLVPGSNSFALTGFINQVAVLGSLNATSFANFLIWGKDSTADGEHLTYYEYALGNRNLTLAMNVPQVLKDSGL